MEHRREWRTGRKKTQTKINKDYKREINEKKRKNSYKADKRMRLEERE